MMTGKGTSPVAGKQQRFLWRGLLIVLPALAMAAFGFLSLRQDRLLVRHQAAEQAEKIAEELVRTILPAGFTLNLHLPDPPALPVLSTQNDPVLGAATHGIIAMLFDEAGQLVFPKPPRWPSPEPLQLDQLDADQFERWTTARRELFAGSDPAMAIPHFEAFLERRPPERFEALARLHLFELALRAGERDQATEHMDQIRVKFGQIKAESGLSVRLLAEWRALRLMDERFTPSTDSEQHLRWLCEQALLDPGPVSESILEQVRQFGYQALQAGIALESGNWPQVTGPWMILHGVARGWTEIYWDAHQKARRMAERLQQTRFGLNDFGRTTGTDWLSFGGRDFLILRQPAANGTWWLAWPVEALRTQVRVALEAVSLPAELACGLELGGRELTPSGPAETRLASRTVALDGGPELTATIWLFDPDLLYVRQRKRTWWFGSLIAVSMVSVLGGAVAAWRGFSDQQRLTELKSNFVSSVSHEMRAPIASVRLMAEELADRGPSDPAKAAEYHGYILQECRRLSALIENVLDFSRHEQGRKQYQFEPTDLGAIVEETLHVMRSYAADRKVALERRIEGIPFELELDAPAIQQVLVNLLDNAIKHSPAGATVEIALAYPESGPGPIPPGRSPANGMPPVRLTVRDRGPGIPEAEQRLIFQRFYRRGSELRRETQGVGLGLAIVQYIVDAHGGSVRVESQPGQGSRFIVELPIAGRGES